MKSLRLLSFLLLGACSPKSPAEDTSASGTAGSSTGATGEGGSETGAVDLTTIAETATAGTAGTTTGTATTTTANPSTDPGTSAGDASTGEATTGPAMFCSLEEQDCPEGQKCNPDVTESIFQGFEFMCVPLVPDPHPPGAPCQILGDAKDDCEKGSVCLDFDGTNDGAGECFEVCKLGSGEPTCDTPGNQCIGLTCQSCSWFICDKSCDVLDPETCSEGKVCIPDGGGSGSIWVCGIDASGAEGQVGDDCEFINACDPGLACVDAGFFPGCDAASGCCSPTCDLKAPNTCPNKDLGASCLPYYEPGQAPEGLENLGVCGKKP